MPFNATGKSGIISMRLCTTTHCFITTSHV